MYKKVFNIIFIIAFMLMCSVPLLFSNLVQGTPSEAEQRMLHGIAKIFKYDGTFNPEVLNEFDGWIDDNIGFRSEVVALNAQIQFHVFDRFTHFSHLCLGPNGEVNSAHEQDILEYQHLNLKTEEELAVIADSFQTFSDYLESKGIQYYYMQCFDKYTIYPEYMPLHIHQYGSVSKTDQVVSAISENTDINLIQIKDKLLAAKENYQPYSRFGDCAHWTQRGSFIAYQELMTTINAHNNNQFPMLEETDFSITLTDQGSDLFGGIHLVDYLENFEILEPNAYETKEKLGDLSGDHNCNFFTNDSVANRTRVLVLADSYVNHYILDELSESFYELVCIHADRTADFATIIETYQPDIVIHENAERADRYHIVTQTAQALCP